MTEGTITYQSGRIKVEAPEQAKRALKDLREDYDGEVFNGLAVEIADRYIDKPIRGEEDLKEMLGYISNAAPKSPVFYEAYKVEDYRVASARKFGDLNLN